MIRPDVFYPNVIRVSNICDKECITPLITIVSDLTTIKFLYNRYIQLKVNV